MVSTALSFGALSPILPLADAAAQTARIITFDIPGQPLNRALRALAAQSGLQIAYNTPVAAGLNAPAVSGPMTADQALARLLAQTGLGFRFSGPNTVTVSAAGDTSAAADGLPGDSATTLETIVISSGTGAAQPGMPFTPDTPFATAGSISYISREQMDRVSATSAGDVFINTPGVISAGNRATASIQPNIRGLQGMGRVRTSIDGAEQTASTYRGYAGNRDETYVDPDMIGGVDITKGPSGGAGSGIGGTVAFRTLTVDDILKEGASHGIRLRGGWGGNSSTPPKRFGGGVASADRPGLLGGESWTGSIAAAATTEHFDFVAGYSRRRQGNYFVGTNSTEGYRFPPGLPGAMPNAILRPGREALNTSEDVQSVLLKGTAKWGDGHSLELGYRLYDNRHGELRELYFGPILGPNYGTDYNWTPTTTRVSTYTGRYRWNPDDNDLINFRANLSHSNLFADRGSNGWGTSGIMGDNRVRTWSGNVGNAAVFDTDLGLFTLDTGAEFLREDAKAVHVILNERLGTWNDSNGPIGERRTFAGFASLKAEFTDWLTVSGGLRYDHFTSKGTGGGSAQYRDRSGSRLSPNAGVTLTPVDGVQLFATYTEGYRAPSLRETHWSAGPVLNNPNVTGEIAKNWEYGVNLLRDDVITSGDRLRFKAAYFDNRYDDYIVRGSQGRPATAPGYWWTNIDHANFEGFEISGSYDAGFFFLEGAYTRYRNIEYCDAGSACVSPTIVGSVGSAPGPTRNDYGANYVPPTYSGSLTAGVRLFEERLTLGGRVQFSDARFGSPSDAHLAATSGQPGINYSWPKYTVYDLFGSYKFNENTVLNFSVENVTDEYYFGALVSAGIPSPGRTARASLTFKF